MGDFNINLLRYDQHNKTTEFVDDMISHGLLPLITQPTRITHQSATLIDHIFTNMLNNTYTSGIMITDLADHFGIFTIIEDIQMNKNPKTIQARSFKETNITIFKEMLASTDFSNIMEIHSPNEAYKEFIKLYQTKFEIAFPLKTKTIQSKYIKKEPWITNAILKSTLTKNNLYKIKLKCPTPENTTKYKIYNVLLNKLKRIQKATYYKTLLKESSGNIKETWKILNKLLRKQNDKSTVSSEFLIDDKLVSNTTEIANGFNTFFAEIGPKINDKVGHPNKAFDKHLTGNYPNTFFINPIIPMDLIHISKMLKSKTSQGFDNISTKLTKLTITEIALPLTHIFNLSFLHGEVPEQLKIAKIIPIFKSGNNTLLNNYRPISLLPAFSKLLEKIVCKQLWNFLNRFDIIYKHQYGFRQKHSTIHPILHFLNSIADTNDLPSKNITLGLFLDLSKAFDTINHEILLKKLDHYGIRGLSNTWLKSYLTNRKQYTHICNTNSQYKDVKCGVPQGSILGTLLFLIYINDIKHSTKLQLLSFADDTTVYLSDPDSTNLMKEADAEINLLFDWLCANKLSLNIGKTKYSLFGPNQALKNVNGSQITLKGEQITRAKDPIKFLGIHIDEQLSWKCHIKKLSSKISRAIFCINRVKNILPFDALKSLYYSLVHSHILYGIQAWGNSPNINTIFKLQKRVIRLIHKKRFMSHTMPLFKKSSILTAPDLYRLQCSLFVYDWMHKRLPNSFENFLTVSDTKTRHNSKLYRTRPRTKFTSHLPKHQYPSIWNSLPENITDIKSRTSFKNQLTSYFINNYNPSTCCTNPNCPDCVK